MATLDSKNIIITGGSLGIGLAVAKKCAQEGATIILAARSKSSLNDSLSELKNISDKPHNVYSIDVSKLDQVASFVDWAQSNYAEINGLVNCAGIYGPIGKTTKVDMHDFTEAININFLGTVYMCSSFAPLIKSDTRKKIVNYSGGGAATPFMNYSAYATSKVAIVRFTENLALELEDEKFDINCVAPGFVITRLHQKTIEGDPNIVGKFFYESTKKQIESGGVSSEKAADLTVFLLSQDSDGISGKFISAPWDPWQTKEFRDLLRRDRDIATLRRIDNKTFYKKI